MFLNTAPERAKQQVVYQVAYDNRKQLAGHRLLNTAPELATPPMWHAARDNNWDKRLSRREHQLKPGYGEQRRQGVQLRNGRLVPDESPSGRPQSAFPYVTAIHSPEHIFSIHTVQPISPSDVFHRRLPSGPQQTRDVELANKSKAGKGPASIPSFVEALHDPSQPRCSLGHVIRTATPTSDRAVNHGSAPRRTRHGSTD